MPQQFSTFTEDKIDHLKRAGLVGSGKTGYGMNGGACPDWLVAEQVAENRRLERLRNKAALGEALKDIEWFFPARGEAA